MILHGMYMNCYKIVIEIRGCKAFVSDNSEKFNKKVIYKKAFLCYNIPWFYGP